MTKQATNEFDPSIDTVAEVDPHKELRDLIKSTKGKIMTVMFVKKNGELRKMVCRTGVKTGINPNARICMNGTTNTTTHIPKYVTVHEMGGGDKKMNLETLKYVKCGKIKYESGDLNEL